MLRSRLLITLEGCNLADLGLMQFRKHLPKSNSVYLSELLVHTPHTKSICFYYVFYFSVSIFVISVEVLKNARKWACFGSLCSVPLYFYTLRYGPLRDLFTFQLLKLKSQNISVYLVKCFEPSHTILLLQFVFHWFVFWKTQSNLQKSQMTFSTVIANYIKSWNYVQEPWTFQSLC